MIKMCVLATTVVARGPYRSIETISRPFATMQPVVIIIVIVIFISEISWGQTEPHGDRPNADRVRELRGNYGWF